MGEGERREREIYDLRISPKHKARGTAVDCGGKTVEHGVHGLLKKISFLIFYFLYE